MLLIAAPAQAQDDSSVSAAGSAITSLANQAIPVAIVMIGLYVMLSGITIAKRLLSNFEEGGSGETMSNEEYAQMLVDAGEDEAAEEFMASNRSEDGLSDHDFNVDYNADEDEDFVDPSDHVQALIDSGDTDAAREAIEANGLSNGDFNWN